MGVRFLLKFLSTLVETASTNLDKTAPGSDGEKHTGNSEQQHAYGVSHGKETKRSHGPTFHESRTGDIHTNQTGPTQ